MANGRTEREKNEKQTIHVKEAYGSYFSNRYVHQYGSLRLRKFYGEFFETRFRQDFGF